MRAYSIVVGTDGFDMPLATRGRAAAADVTGKIACAARADLPAVGDRDLGTIAGRNLGSIPLDVARQSGTDGLIHAT